MAQDGKKNELTEKSSSNRMEMTRFMRDAPDGLSQRITLDESF
jgi:hypothetical protein